jgi:hypothetical protein
VSVLVRDVGDEPEAGLFLAAGPGVRDTDPQTRTFVMQPPKKFDHLVLSSSKMRNLAVDPFSRIARFRSSRQPGSAMNPSRSPISSSASTSSWS